MSFTIAIDGPAAAGKGTISKAVAEAFGFAHLDTGLLYRAVGAKTLLGADPVKAALALTPNDLKADNLRTTEIAQAASKVAIIPEVRNALIKFQRHFSARDEGAVLDGRDIGTVICPDATVKLFITASAESRADRRFKELSEKGFKTTYKQVLADVIARDQRDTERETAPMSVANDAIIIDTSEMTINKAIATVVDIIQTRLNS